MRDVEIRGKAAGPDGSGPRRILFFLRGIHFGRVFENFLRAMLERGHHVHIALMLEKRGLGEDKSKLFDELRKSYPNFSYEQLAARRDRWLVPAVALRHGLDYLRYLEPDFAHAGPLRDRARVRAPMLLRALLAVPPFRWGPGRHLIRAVLGGFERAIPVPEKIVRMVEKRRPDVVLVSPLVGLGSIETDYLRAAQEAGIPTVLPVASWDNLTNKGLLHDIPTLTIVWNHEQVDEAVRLHNVPTDRVVAVGAHSFDHWFSWRPSTTREEFAARRALDPERPLILYLGSSYFISGDETPYVREWLGRVREHPRLKEAAVILRQHPQNAVGWEDLVDEPGKTVVWPRQGEAPTDEEKKADFFDTLFHSTAVVGINTSAQIEAAIVGRPVLTLVSDHFATQKGTLHFSYLAYEEDGNGGGGGVVTVGHSWDEHLDQIADAIESPAAYRERTAAFVADFVRPHGLDRAAAPAAVDAVEHAASTSVAPRPVPLLRRVLVLLAPLLVIFIPIVSPRRTWRAAVKAARRNVKQFRRWRKQRVKARRARAKTGVAVAAKMPDVVAKAGTPAKAPKPAKVAKPAKEANPPRVEPEPVAAAASADKFADWELLMMTPEQIQIERERRRVHERNATRDRLKAEALKASARQKAQSAREREQARAAIRQVGVETVVPSSAAPAAVEQKPAKAPKAKPEQLTKPAKPEKAKARKAAGAAKAKPKRKPLKPRLEKRARGIAKRGRRRVKRARRDVRAVYNRRYRYSYASTITRVPARDEIPALLNVRGLLGDAVEIGVKTGRYSEQLLRAWKGRRLISIDPWLEAAPEEYVDRSNVSQDEFDENYLETKRRLAPFGERSEIWRLMSVEAAEKVPDGSLDFAYIDARHDYASVLEDLAAWFPKVKPGGILAGHDYVDGMLPQGDFGVKSAVDEFFAERNIPVHGTEGPSAVEMFPTWIVEIPSD